MAAMDFPDNPAVGDLFGSAGTTWRWDGTRWAAVTGAPSTRGVVAYARQNVTQGPFTGTTTDIPGMTVQFVANPTRTYRTTVYGEWTSSVAGDVPIMTLADSANNPIARDAPRLVQADISAKSITQLVETGLSGLTTRKARGIRAIGTGTVQWQASTAFPAFILVEDITFSDAAGGPVGPPAAVAQGNLSALGITGVFQAIPFASLGFNTAPADILVDNATGRFTVMKAGKYRASWQYTVNAAAANAVAYVHCYCEHMIAGGGSAIRQIENLVGSATVYLTISGSAVFDMAVGEIARLTVSTTNTPTTTAIRGGVFSLERVA
jgi:hypothetical protein